VRGDGDPAIEEAAFAAKPTDADKTRRVTVKYGSENLWVELKFPLSNKKV